MKLNHYIDHTALKPETAMAEIAQLCKEAKENQFKSVCVNPCWVAYASEQLQGSDVLVCTVIGFPLGATTSVVKAFEAAHVVAHGAKEVDMVINIGALKSGELDIVEEDIHAVVKAVQSKALVKVIIETALLTDDEKQLACELAVHAGADFVKTSTGFLGGGATEGDIALMRQVVGTKVGVKASGGVRNQEDASKMIQAGANRIGTSAGVAIVQGELASKDY